MLASQLAIGWTNDWLDADRDAEVGRTDKPIPSGAVAADTVGVGAVVAGIAVVPLALLSGWRRPGDHRRRLVSGLAYDWPLKFTAFSVLPYARLVRRAAPRSCVLALPGAPAPPWWLVAAGALLGGGAHFANVLPDLADDARTGVRGLPHRLGADGLLGSRPAALLLGRDRAAGLRAARTTVVAGVATFAAAAVVPAARLAPAPGAPGSRAAFRAVLVVAVLDVILLVANGARI